MVTTGPNVEAPRATRILVTGAAGFVGGAVCRALGDAGHHVTAVTRTPGAASRVAGRHVALGTLSRATFWDEVLAGTETIIHLAGRAHVMNDDPRQAERLYREGNVEVLEALVAAALRCGVRRLVLVSSIKVNGEATAGPPMRASDPPAPEDAYGRSKLEAEQALQVMAGRSLEWVILRPPLMYGPGVRGNILRLFSHANRGWPVPFGSISNARDLLYVGSFAELIAIAAHHPDAAGRVFLARDGDPVSTPTLYRAIAYALGRKPRILPCPVALLQAIGRAAGRSDETRRLTGNLRIDDSDTRRRLGWQPGIGMEEAMQLTAQWFKAL
ncbi:MAG: NAD-dependent epimerase/dehydratase family protein [Hyphomicrobium sp.]